MSEVTVRRRPQAPRRDRAHQRSGLPRRLGTLPAAVSTQRRWPARTV